MQNRETPTTAEKKGQAAQGRDTRVYEWRMDAASETKIAALLRHFPEMFDGAVVVDMGSGTGLVLQKIVQRLRRDGFQVRGIAVDISHEFYEQAKDKAQVELVFGDAATQVFPPESVYVLYFSTSGHEIESFGGKGKMLEAVANAFVQLMPGGRLIIRDFVKPDFQKPFYMELPDDDGDPADPQADPSEIDYSKLSTKARFCRFHQEFAGGSAFSYQEVEIDGKHLIKIDPEWAYEFYMRKEYTGNWRNEIHEKYSYWTMEEAENALRDSGFIDVKVEADPSQYMLTNWLENKVGLYTQDDQGHLFSTPFPATHMVVSGTKPPAQALGATTGVSETNLGATDFAVLRQSIVIDEENGFIQFRPLTGRPNFPQKTKTFAIDPATKKEGNKFVIYALKDRPDQIIKLPSSHTTDQTFEQQVNLTKAFFQTVSRQEELEAANIPHLSVVEHDETGPPYRYVIQEALPASARSLADEILDGNLNDAIIKEICGYINSLEQGKRYQIDSNPFAWYLDESKPPGEQLIYASGKVYAYDERWEFSRVGLLQWCQPELILGGEYYSAAIPTSSQISDFWKTWCNDTSSFQVWKRYLHRSVQPGCTAE